MVKLYQQLEQLFKFRVNSNEEIIPYIKKLSEAGKFDEPKKVAVLAIILDRIGKMEDEATLQESLKADDINKIGGTYNPTMEIAAKEITPAEEAKVQEIPAPTEATTSPDAPQQPEQAQVVQTPVETPTDTTQTPPTEEATPETPVDDESIDDGNDKSVSEFSLDAITDTPTSKPEVEPVTSS